MNSFIFNTMKENVICSNYKDLACTGMSALCGPLVAPG